MKHTDYYSILQSLKKNEIKELVEAVKAHNGKVSFDTGEEDWLDWDAPIIILNIDPGPADAVITEVSIKNEHLVIKGFDKEDTETNIVKIETEDILPGQISFIIDKIPETDTVKAVTAFDDVNKLRDELFGTNTSAI